MSTEKTNSNFSGETQGGTAMMSGTVYTVIFKGNLSQQRFPVATRTEAKQKIQELVDQMGESARNKVIVQQNSSGFEYRPEEL